MPGTGRKEALMSLTTTILLLICGWLAVAAAMLWGVMRVTRRHHHPGKELAQTEDFSCMPG